MSGPFPATAREADVFLLGVLLGCMTGLAVVWAAWELTGWSIQ